MSDPDAIRIQAERIRASKILGRTGHLSRVFDYLVERSLSGAAPKEIDVAVDALGRSEFDSTQDTTVRVYVHRLRRRLDEYYRTRGSAEPVHLSVPKGEYRVELTPAQTVAPQPEGDEHEPPLPARRGSAALWLALGVSVALNLFVLASGSRSDVSDSAFTEVRQHPFWSGLFDDDLPIYLVVGDYYVFGESMDGESVQRLVRYFDINSPQDLEHYIEREAIPRERFQNLDLAYLPTSAAFALRDILPVLEAKQSKVRVILASELDALMLKSAHIVYIGYLSGMGMLHDLTFAASRFVQGESYDELLDRVAHKTYVSEMRRDRSSNSPSREYSLISTFAGPANNRIVVIAGTRDVALMQAAEMLANANRLDEIERATNFSRSFEALYEVTGFRRVNVNGNLQVASALDDAKIWRMPIVVAVTAN